MKKKICYTFSMKRFIAFFGVLSALTISIFSLGQKESPSKTGDIMEKSESNFQVNQGSVPARILSLVPSTTEIIFALEAQDSLVARTDFCNWPPETKNTPSVGGFDGKTISLERIVAYKPDLVCLADVMHNHLIQPLENLGIQVFMSDSQTMEDIYQEIFSLGSVLGRQKEAQALCDLIQAQLEEAKNLVASKTTGGQSAPQKVYWEVAASPYFSPGKDSFLTDLLAVLGLQNIFYDLPQSYPQVSEEGIIARQPDLIFFPDYNSLGLEAAQAIARRPGWQNLPAVRDGRIYPVDSDLFSRPGPRLGQMALDLAKLIVSQKLVLAEEGLSSQEELVLKPASFSSKSQPCLWTANLSIRGKPHLGANL